MLDSNCNSITLQKTVLRLHGCAGTSSTRVWTNSFDPLHIHTWEISQQIIHTRTNMQMHFLTSSVCIYVYVV